MSRSVVLAWLGAVVIAAAAMPSCVAGSGREDLAIQRLETALCEKSIECGCAEVAPECGEWPSTLIRDGAGAFDPDCIDRWITWLDPLSCGGAVLPGYDELCPLYHGTIRAGEPCERESLTETDCERGLFCISGVCHDPQRVALGGPSQRCDLGERCDAGLECIGERCERLPSGGEACLQLRCDADSRCNGERCVALPGPGQVCESGECRGEAFCSFDPTTGFNECRSRGDVGDPCRGHEECVSGNCPAGVCEYPAKVGDRCSDRLPCGPGQWCEQGVCEAIQDADGPTSSGCNLLRTL